MKIYKIVTLGGGTGHYSLLSALKQIDNIEITAVVSMADNGGSTGTLRDKMGALPPGDILKALLALSEFPDEFTRPFLLNRFTQINEFKGHNVGNLLLTLFHQYSGSFLKSINALGEVLKIKGRVLPVTVGNIMLHAMLENGQEIVGETNIDIPKHNPSLGIQKVWLSPCALALGSVNEAIRHADYLILSPGDLWTSIIPVLLVSGVKEACQQSTAKKILISNIMTKYGETSGYTMENFLSRAEEYMGCHCDMVLYNTTRPTSELLEKYAKENAEFVECAQKSSTRHIIFRDLLEENGLARHDVKKLKKALEEIFFT